MTTPGPAAEAALADTRLARQLDRRRQIVDAVAQEGAIRIEDIAMRFGISLMTAHRDLDELASRGILRKTRGMASATPTSLVESADVYRVSRQLAEKRAIARAALQLVEPGQAVFLDDSTTVLQMAAGLAELTPLTVITNSLTLCNEVKAVRDLTLLMLGGQYHSWCNAFLGRITTQDIARLRADTLFMSMSAITEDQVFHQFPEMIDAKRAMFDAAATRVLLADHTKFGRRALHGFAPLTSFDAVIVDEGVPAAEVARMRDGGVRVVVAS